MIQWHLHKIRKHDTRRWFDFCVDSAEERGCGGATFYSSDCFYACHSSVTLPLCLAVRLRIRGFGLSSVRKAVKLFKQTVIYQTRLWKMTSSTHAGRTKPKYIKEQRWPQIQSWLSLSCEIIIWSLTWCCELSKWSKLCSSLHRTTDFFPQTQVRPFMPHLPTTIFLLQHPHSAPSFINFPFFPSIHPFLPHLHSPFL